MPGDLTAEVGPTAEYGAFVEYGTSRMRAQPYMTPASEQAGEWFVNHMARNVGIR
jgi:HK97 gp10 family phage protein